MALSERRTLRTGRSRRSRIGCPPIGTPRSSADRHAGFTLTEFLVAAALFGIMALALGKGIMVTIRSDRQAGEQSRAVALAVDKMERLKAIPADALVAEPPRLVQEDGTEGSGLYRRWVDVSAEGDNAKTVVVHVEYPTGGGKRAVSLRTLIFAPK